MSRTVPSRVDQWFKTEVLPCEEALTRFLRRHVTDAAEVADLRQDVYMRLYEAGTAEIPPTISLWPLVHTIARNLLIDRSRRAKVIPIDFAAEHGIDVLPVEFLTPERHAGGRDDLRRFEQGLQRLPERCRQVIRLRKIEGLSQRECAERMAISQHTVERHLLQGMRALADYMIGGAGRVIHITTRPAKSARK